MSRIGRSLAGGDGAAGHDQLLRAGPAPVRERGVTVRSFPSSRRLVTAAVRAGRRIVPMHGLFEVDITAARRLLAEDHPPLSLTAFVVASLGRAAAAHPQVHAYRDWRGRLVEHRHVDTQTLIEVPTSQGPFGLVHVVRDADVRSVAAISAELRSVKTDPATTTTGRRRTPSLPPLGGFPASTGDVRGDEPLPPRHLATGTVQVTAVGMFADGRLRHRPAPLGPSPSSSAESSNVPAPSATASKCEISSTSPSHRPNVVDGAPRHPVRAPTSDSSAHRCRTGTGTHSDVSRCPRGTQQSGPACSTLRRRALSFNPGAVQSGRPPGPRLNFLSLDSVAGIA